MQDQKDSVVELLKSVLTNKTFAFRGDYTTFFRYVLVLLTGQTDGFKFDKPTAVSKARWMGKTNYASVLVLLKDKIFEELPQNMIMTTHQAELLERFVKFVCLVYVKWWVRCPLVCESGIVDLELLSDIRNYPDKIISTAAADCSQTPPLVPDRRAGPSVLVFLSTITIKERIACKLLASCLPT